MLRIQSEQASGAESPVADEYLAFRLGREEYGIGIQSVQELRGYERPTHIANSAEHVKGVINLRGVIVPIIDMRIKFDIGEPTYDQFTVVVVLNIGKQVMGMVVDGVSDVIALSGEQIKPAPDGGGLDHECLLGLATLDERMVILLDIDALLSREVIGGKAHEKSGERDRVAA